MINLEVFFYISHFSKKTDQNISGTRINNEHEQCTLQEIIYFENK